MSASWRISAAMTLYKRKHANEKERCNNPITKVSYLNVYT